MDAETGSVVSSLLYSSADLALEEAVFFLSSVDSAGGSTRRIDLIGVGSFSSTVL